MRRPYEQTQGGLHGEKADVLHACTDIGQDCWNSLWKLQHLSNGTNMMPTSHTRAWNAQHSLHPPMLVRHMSLLHKLEWPDDDATCVGCRLSKAVTQRNRKLRPPKQATAQGEWHSDPYHRIPLKVADWTKLDMRTLRALQSRVRQSCVAGPLERTKLVAVW